MTFEASRRGRVVAPITAADSSALRYATGGYLFAITTRGQTRGSRLVVYQANERGAAESEARELRGHWPRVFERLDRDEWRRTK